MENEIKTMIEGGRHLVPPHMWSAVEFYFVNRYAPGHFLTALLSNDLMEAFSRADDLNAANMQRWCRFLYNYAPRGSYGSPAAFNGWLTQEREAA
jgi:hypothetical protein